MTILIFFFTKLSEIDPCEKRIDMLGGHAWRHIFMACSKLEAMAIYVVKQACGNEIMPSVYLTLDHSLPDRIGLLPSEKEVFYLIHFACYNYKYDCLLLASS